MDLFRELYSKLESTSLDTIDIICQEAQNLGANVKQIYSELMLTKEEDKFDPGAPEDQITKEEDDESVESPNEQVFSKTVQAPEFLSLTEEETDTVTNKPCPTVSLESFLTTSNPPQDAVEEEAKSVSIEEVFIKMVKQEVALDSNNNNIKPWPCTLGSFPGAKPPLINYPASEAFVPLDHDYYGSVETLESFLKRKDKGRTNHNCNLEMKSYSGRVPHLEENFPYMPGWPSSYNLSDYDDLITKIPGSDDELKIDESWVIVDSSEFLSLSSQVPKNSCTLEEFLVNRSNKLCSKSCEVSNNCSCKKKEKIQSSSSGKMVRDLEQLDKWSRCHIGVRLNEKQGSVMTLTEPYDSSSHCDHSSDESD